MLDTAFFSGLKVLAGEPGGFGNQHQPTSTAPTLPVPVSDIKLVGGGLSVIKYLVLFPTFLQTTRHVLESFHC